MKNNREAWIAEATIIASIFGLLVSGSRNIAEQLENKRNSTEIEVATKSDITDESIEQSDVDIEALGKQEIHEKIEELLKDINKPGMIICSGHINIRSSPSLSDESNIIAMADNLAVCDVLATYDNVEPGRIWHKVKFGDIEGYVLDDYIEIDNLSEGLFEKAIVNTVKVDGSTIEYAEAEELEENAIAIIEDGSLIEVTSFNPEWYIINQDDVYSFVKKSDALELQDSSFRTAKTPKRTESFMNEFTNFGISVNKTLVEVKLEPDEDSDSVGALPGHVGVDLMAQVVIGDESWSYINSGRVSGYVKSKYILTGEEAYKYGQENAKLMAFTGEQEQEVYKDATRLSKVWTYLAKNQCYEVLNQNKYWVELALDTGDATSDIPDRAFINIENENVDLKYSIGVAIPYIDSMVNKVGPKLEEVYPNGNMELRQQIIAYACQFIGNPYVWGGTDLENGADCSGFVQSVLKHFNIYVPRVSYDQATVGNPVTAEELQPGDLVFYAGSNGVVNHVAMYIGNGMIVNAGSSRTGILLNIYNYRTPVAMKDVIGNRMR